MVTQSVNLITLCNKRDINDTQFPEDCDLVSYCVQLKHILHMQKQLLAKMAGLTADGIIYPKNSSTHSRCHKKQATQFSDICDEWSREFYFRRSSPYGSYTFQ